MSGLPLRTTAPSRMVLQSTRVDRYWKELVRSLSKWASGNDSGRTDPTGGRVTEQDRNYHFEDENTTQADDWTGASQFKDQSGLRQCIRVQPQV